MTTGRINQVNEAVHESCREATRREAMMEEKQLTRDIFVDV